MPPQIVLKASKNQQSKLNSRDGKNCVGETELTNGYPWWTAPLKTPFTDFCTQRTSKK